MCARNSCGPGSREGASIGRLSGAGASTVVLSSTLGIARCGSSAGCVLGVLLAVPAAVWGGGVPCGGKHIIIVAMHIGGHCLDGECYAYGCVYMYAYMCICIYI